MAIPPYVNDVAILADVAAALKLSGASALPAYYTDLAPLAHLAATGIIYSRLTARGYTPTQLVGWDLGPWLERILATVETLRLAGAAESIPDAVLKLYDAWTAKDGLLDTVLLTSGGVWAAPQDTPGTAQSGGVCFEPSTFPIRPPGFERWDGGSEWLGW